jgi:hypothetical protein
MNTELKDAINTTSSEIGMDPRDMATIFSYETGGTFDPWQKGPTTQYGVHRGLIQWGEPQRAQYGINETSSITDQVKAAGRYFVDRGYKPGMGLLQAYAAVNAGNVNAVHASDANNGGAPGDVTDKVNNQMEGHKSNAAALLGGTYVPSQDTRQDGATNYSLGVEVPVSPTMAIPGTPKADDAPEGPGIWQTQKDAFNQNSTIAFMLNSNPYAADPLYQKKSNEDQLADLESRGLDPEHYAKFIGNSTSAAGYEKALQDAVDDRDRLQRLSEAGLKGTLLNLANQMLDPVSLATDIAVSSFAPELVLGKYATKVNFALRSAIAGGAGGLAAGAVNYSLNPNGDMADVAIGAAMGFGVGGLVGKLMGAPATHGEAARIRSAARDSVREYEGSTAPSALAVPNMAGSAGARNVGVAERSSAFEDLFNEDIAPVFGRAARGDNSAMFDKSKNPATRSVGSSLVQEGAGRKSIDGVVSINGKAASEEKDMLKDEFLTRYARTYTAQLKAHMEANGINVMQQVAETPAMRQMRREFDTEITKYIRDTRSDRAAHYSKAVKTAGDEYANNMAELLDMLKNPFKREGEMGGSVYGFDTIPNNKHYITREWEPAAILGYGEKYQEGTLETLVTGGIQAANRNMDAALAGKIGKALVKTLRNSAHGFNDDVMRRLSSDDASEMIDILKAQGGLSDEHAAEIADYFKKTNVDENGKPKGDPDAGKDARAKGRTLLREDFELKGPILRGSGVADEGSLKISDLLNNNSLDLYHKYVERASGNWAMARVRIKNPATGEWIVDGIKSDGDFEKLLEAVRKRGSTEKGVSKKSMDEDEARLRWTYNKIKGRDTSNGLESSNFGFGLRMLRKYNYTRIMNLVGLAQIPELANVVGSTGFKAAFSQMPAVRRIISMDGKSILKDNLQDDIEAIFGFGGERMTRMGREKYDEVAMNLGGHSRIRDTIDNALTTANKLTSEISGMTQINIMSQRWASRAVIQKFANVAAGRAKMSAKRLADLGIDGDMAKRVWKEVNNAAVVKKDGNRVIGLDFEKFADKEAGEHLRRAIYRKTNEIIQKNDIGNLSMWMSHPVGKVFMQFRQFMAASYVKQTMKAIHMRDAEAGTNIALGMAVAGMVYTAQQKVAAIGRSDADAFLEKRLSTEKIVAAGIGRIGTSSILPAIVSTVSKSGLYDDPFDAIRTSGSASDLWSGNTVSSLINDGTAAVKGGVDFMSGNGSQEGARAIQRIGPFSNAVFYTQGFNSMISDLPQFAPRD